MEELLTAEAVAIQLGVATTTLELWYKWKKHHPEHPLAELMPDPVRISKRRFWKPSDVEKLRVFQQSKPNGRGGLFAEFTYKKKEDK